MTTSSPGPAPAPDLARWAPWWLLAYVALWPLVSPAELVLSLGAIYGAGVLALGRFRGGLALLSPEAWALTSLLFLAYWVPEAVSAIDAADPVRSLREALLDLRYLPFLWLVAMAVARAPGRRTVLDGLAVIVAAWVADGLVQAATGWSLGGPITEDRLSGVFGSDNLKLGVVLASLSPFLLEAAAHRWRIAGWLLAAAALGLVVLLAGARAAWLSLTLVLLWSGARHFGRRQTWLSVLVIAGLALPLSLALSTPMQARLERSAAILDGGVSGLDHALSGRITIWRSALQMSAEHPVNGVGVRGFRAAYPRYIQPGDPPLEDGLGYHAHQIVLEVLSETGLVGLLLWLAGVAMAWRAWRVAPEAARARARAPALALAATVFPLNTHLAFYSTFWGGLTLLLVALYAGSLLASDPD